MFDEAKRISDEEGFEEQADVNARASSNDVLILITSQRQLQS